MSQLDQGQLLQGWFPLVDENRNPIPKHQSMVNVVLQYQSVLQARSAPAHACLPMICP